MNLIPHGVAVTCGATSVETVAALTCLKQHGAETRPLGLQNEKKKRNQAHLKVHAEENKISVIAPGKSPDVGLRTPLLIRGRELATCQTP